MFLEKSEGLSESIFMSLIPIAVVRRACSILKFNMARFTVSHSIEKLLQEEAAQGRQKQDQSICRQPIPMSCLPELSNAAFQVS
jgi:hypothetical protein